MTLLNNLINTKPLRILTYKEYLDTHNIHIENISEDFIINKLQYATNKFIYHYGMYFLINKKSTNNILKCIRILKDKLIKYKEVYIYEILKYIIDVLDISQVLQIFNNNDLSSMIIGEYLIRNKGITLPIKELKNVLYTFIPFYIYKIEIEEIETNRIRIDGIKEVKEYKDSITKEKDTSNTISNITTSTSLIDILIERDIRIIALFPGYINTDLRVQYYILNIYNQSSIKINDDVIEISSDGYIDYTCKYNPYTNYLIYKYINKNTLGIDYIEEFCILNYKEYPIFNIQSIYLDVIRWYHTQEINAELSLKDINYLLENKDIYTSILKKYNLLKKDCNYSFLIRDNYSVLIYKYILHILMLTPSVFNLEYVMNMNEEYFILFIRLLCDSKENKYIYKGREIEKDILDLIREYHKSRVSTKKYRDMVVDKILKHKDRDVYEERYSKRENSRETYNVIDIEGEWNKDIEGSKESDNIKNVIIRDYFCNKDSISANSINLDTNTSIYSIPDNITSTINTLLDTNTNFSLDTNTKKRYKLNKISTTSKTNTKILDITTNTLLNTSTTTNTFLIGLRKSKWYTRIIVDREYISSRYTTRDRSLSKYLLDEYIIQNDNIVLDLIRHNIYKISRIVRRGYVLNDYQCKEVLNRIKEEGDKKKMEEYCSVLGISSDIYICSMVVYEEAGYIGRKGILKYINKVLNKIAVNRNERVNDKVDNGVLEGNTNISSTYNINISTSSYINKHTLVRLLLILTNENSIRLVLRILDILKYYKHILNMDKYKKGTKYIRLLIRGYPLIEGYDKEHYNKLLSQYKYEEEKIILKKYHNII